ncbi:DUF4302 domain-containing protein [Chitinophaga qingshengii]|uniref:DUF4302 domain-containing protein n=1 Tax=Chitinophaga qingshengii TaxID=1569794 RepID=A0ABR7TQ70_9BACT|nr:DUF4302 domain-containing protein [Chitinophaga qingshengii]MBC9932630.1 DUF4302 domain-containing protein [Chitinophaga qingshengii]
MRKELLYLLLLLAGIYSCKKETDPLFDKSPDERINDTLHRYQQILTQAPYGWKALVYPGGSPKSVFSFYLQFNDSNRVRMFSDFEPVSTSTVKESSWRLKALQQPSLLFDTYSYLHVLCDPDAGQNGGNYGEGLGSDFEFAINGITGDTLVLTGRFNRSRAILVKASQREQTDYYQQHINRGIDSINHILTYFRQFALGNVRYDVSINIYTHRIVFTRIDNGKVKSDTTGFYYTNKGIVLTPAFTDGTTTIGSFDDITWDGGAIRGTVNGQPASITETVRPLALDIAAPKRWYNYALDRHRYWNTPEGFIVNGKRDAYGLATLPDFVAATYWPEAGGPGTDAFGIIVPEDGQLTLMYGVLHNTPTFTNDGRIVFHDNRLFGDLPPDPTPLVRTRTLMADPTGFFLVQTSANTYDMVSAKDGKSWISWVF